MGNTYRFYGPPTVAPGTGTSTNVATYADCQNVDGITGAELCKQLDMLFHNMEVPMLKPIIIISLQFHQGLLQMELLKEEAVQFRLDL